MTIGRKASRQGGEADPTAGDGRSWRSAHIPMAPFALAAILLLFFTLCFFAQQGKSVTVDEFSHLPAGLYNLKTQDWRMDSESPPLVKCFPGAIVVLLAKPIVPLLPPEVIPNAWDYGYRFMGENFSRYREIFTWGRVATITISALGGWLVYAFAARLFGTGGGLVSLLLYAANPNIIAHAQLATIDAGAMVFFLTAVMLFWRFLGCRTIPAALLSGLGLGLAALSKFTTLILIPLMLLIIVLTDGEAWQQASGDGRTRSGALFFTLMHGGIILSVCLVTIDAGYLFSGLFHPLAGLPLASEIMKTLAASPLGRIPIPLPNDYISGFDIQLAIAQGNEPFYRGYLMGEHSQRGWWYYYPVGLFVKNPEILWGFIGISLWGWLRGVPRPPLRSWLCLWGIPLTFLIYFSLGTHIPIGLRFLLPIFPLLFVACGGIVPIIPWKGVPGKALIGGMLFLYCLPAVAIFPDHLAYFNLAAGGPQNGHRWLIDSNLDWGQDLPALKRFMGEQGIPTVKLGYFGRVDPHIYGIRYSLAERSISPGWHAISVNFLVGRPYYLLADGKLHYIDADYYAAYRSLIPKTVLGHTLVIFSGDEGKLPLPESDQVGLKGRP